MLTADGDKENEDLRVRFDVDKASFPAYRLFKRKEAASTLPAATAAAAAAAGQPPVTSPGAAAPLVYGGRVDKDALTQWLSEETGLYIGLPGTLEAFDALASGFLAPACVEMGGEADGGEGGLTRGGDRAGWRGTVEGRGRYGRAEAALAALRVAAAEGSDAAAEEVGAAKAYVRIMSKVLQQGPAFVKREAKRVKALMGGRITSAKRTFFKERLNILASFTGSDDPKDEL